MNVFVYKVADRSGKILKGTLDAQDETSAVRILQDQGYIPIRVHPSEARPDAALTRWTVDIFHRVSSKDVMVVTQDLAVLLGAGLLFELLGGSVKRTLYSCWQKIGEYLEDG